MTDVIYMYYDLGYVTKTKEKLKRMKAVKEFHAGTKISSMPFALKAIYFETHILKARVEKYRKVAVTLFVM